MSFNPYTGQYDMNQPLAGLQQQDMASNIVDNTNVYAMAIRNPYQEAMQQRLANANTMQEQEGASFGNVMAETNMISKNPYLDNAQDRARSRAVSAHLAMASRLGDQQAEQDQLAHTARMATGMSEKDSLAIAEQQQSIRGMSDEDRAKNYEIYKRNPSQAKPDIELVNDITNASIEEIKSKYHNKPEMMNYILGQKEQLGQASMAQGLVANDQSGNTIFNPKNFIAGIASGFGETIGAVDQLHTMLTSDGEERVYKMQNGLGKDIQNETDNWKNLSGQVSDKIADGQDVLNENSNQNVYAQAIASGKSKDEAGASVEANDVSNTIDKFFDNPMQLANEAVQVLPDIVTSLAGVGAVSGFTKTLGKRAIQQAGKNFDNIMANQLEQKIITEEMSKGVSAKEANILANKTVAEAKENYMKNISEDIAKKVERNTRIGASIYEGADSTIQNAPQGYETASQNILDIPLEQLKETEGFKELKNQYPEKSDKDLQMLMADEAGKKGFTYAGLASLASGAIGGQAEANLVLGRAKGLYNKAVTATINAAEEAGEEGGSVLGGNIATNQQTKEDSIYALKGVGKSATTGALASGISTGALSVPAGLKGTLEKGLGVITNSQEKKLIKQSNQAVNTVLGSNDDSDTSIFKGKKFSETNFGKQYNQVKEQLKTSGVPEFEKLAKDGNYTGTVVALNQQRLDLLEAEKQERAEGNNSEADKLATQAETLKGTLDGLFMSLHTDLQDNIKSFKDKMLEIQKAQSETVPDADKINQLWDEYDALLKNDDKVQGLQDSTLYKVLDTATRDTVTSDQAITSADILGSGNFSMSPTQAFNQAVNQNSEAIQAISSAKTPEEIKKHTINMASNIAKFSASLASNMPKNIQEANKVKAQVRMLVEQIQQTATKTNSKELNKIADIFGTFLDKPIPSGTNIKAYTETMFGGTNAGLMDYLTRALANGGKLSDMDNMNLTKFVLSQQGKIAGVNQAIASLQSDPTTPVEVTNRALRPKDNDYVMKNQQGKNVTLSSVNQAKKYLQRTTAEAKYFNEIANTILGLDVANQQTKQSEQKQESFKQNKKPQTDVKDQNQKQQSQDTSTLDISWSSDRNKELSNLAPRPFTIKDKDDVVRNYRSVEHFYQTWKSGQFDEQAFNSKNSKPKGKFKVNNDISETVMKFAITKSFQQNKKALEGLLATKGKTLTHTMDKGHWGTAFPKLLMEVRNELENYQATTQINQPSQTKQSTQPIQKGKVADLDVDSYQTADKSMDLTSRLAISQPMIADRVIALFDSIKEQWSKQLGNELTEFDTPETDTIIELNTSEGIKEFRIPMSAMVELNRKGFDPTINLLDATTNKEKTKQTKEQADKFINSPTTDGLTKNQELGSALSLIAKNTKNYFGRRALSVFDSNYKSPLGQFHLVNGLLNLVSVERDGEKIKTVIPSEVQLAFVKAQAVAMANYRDLAFGKDKQYEEYWTDDLNAQGEPTIYNSTQAEKLGEKHSSNKREEVDLDHYSDLGITRNDFIEMLGKNVIEQLGLTFNKSAKEYSSDIENGLIYSLGLDLYNSMLNQGLLEAHNVELKVPNTEGTLDTKVIPYVNYKINQEPKDSQDVQALTVLESGLDSPDMSVEQAKAIIAKKPILQALANLSNNINSEEVQNIFETKELNNTGVRISSISGRIGSKPKLQGRISKSDTKNDITNTSNPELDSAIAHMNNVAYGLNNPLFNLLKAQPEGVQLALGYIPNPESLPKSDASIRAIKSKNNDITRAVGLLHKFVNQAKEMGLLEEDMMFQFKHHFVPNMRTMLQADMNPQGNKIIREMLRLVTSDISEEDGKITGELKLSIDLGTKRSKFNTDGRPRTVQDLIAVAKGRRSSQARNFAVGFLLALNQGLDIGKIEKSLQPKIFADVEEALSDPTSLYSRMTDLVWKMQQAQEQDQELVLSKEEKALLSEFGSELGNGAARALNAIQSWANFKYRGTEQDALQNKRGRKQFDTALLLEADGIGNGLHNITRQFVVKFTPAYFNTLKRTGMITMDVLSQITIKQLSQKEQSKLVNNFEGSAGMFKPVKNAQGQDETLRDIYEVIADKLSKEATVALQHIKGYVANNNLDIRDMSYKEFNKLFRDKEFNQLPEDIKADIQFISQLHTSGMVEDKDGNKVTDLIFEPYNNIALPLDFLLQVKRNLAKAGVTPTVYGGQLQGIASQLFGDNKATIIAKGDKLIELSKKYDEATTQEEKNSLDKEKDAIFEELAATFTALGLNYDKSVPKDLDLNSEFEIAKQIVNQNNRSINNHKQEFISALKDGLATKLRNAVQESYVDEFAMLNFAMAQDDIAFANFSEEFTNKVKQAIKERNKVKGYAPNDPRNHSPLSRKEIRDIISSITSAPVIATAFNADSVLFEDVFEMGNSLVKQGSYSLKEQSTINSSFANNQGNWYHNVTTQLMRSYRRYLAAGASNATATIPSTESKTQATLAERLFSMLSGITSLNVFDGIDGLLYFREILGSIANEQTNKVHLDTSILNNFYNKFVKSGLGEVINNTSVLSKELMTKLSKSRNIGTMVDYVINNKTSTRAELKYVLAVLSLKQMELEYSKTLHGYGTPETRDALNKTLKVINTFKSKISEAIDLSIQNNTELATITGGSANEKNSIDNYLNKLGIQGYSLNGKPLDKSATIQQHLVGMFNTNLKRYIHSVASNRAIKYIEAKYLPVIINQFAGGNRGFFYNADQLSSVGKRFKDFVINKYGSDTFANMNFLTDSSMLVDFLNNDPEIQEEFNKKYEEVKSKLHKPYIQDGSNVNTAKTKGTISTFTEYSSNLGSTIELDTPLKRILTMLNKLIGNQVPVITSLTEEQAEQLLPKGKKIKDTKSRQESIKQLVNTVKSYKFAGTSHVYSLVNEDGSNPEQETRFEYIWMSEHLSSDYTGQMLAHEGIHSVSDSLINFMVFPEYAQQLDKDNPELSSQLVNFASRLQANIEKFVSKNQNLDAIQKNLDTLRNNPAMRHHYMMLAKTHKQGLPNKVANIANYIYFFSELNEDNLPQGWTKEMLYQARQQTMHELLAYSLTDYDTANELSVHKEAKWYSALTGSLSEMYKAIRSIFYGMFGLNTDKPSEEVSMMEAMLESIYSFNQLSNPTITNDLQMIAANNIRKGGNKYFGLMKNSYMFQAGMDNWNNNEELTEDNNIANFSMVNSNAKPSNPINSRFRDIAQQSINAIKPQLDTSTIEYPNEVNTLLDTKINHQINDVLAKLRQAKYSINLDEENDIKLAYKLNTIAQDTNNKASKHLSTAISEVVNNLPDNVVESINKSKLDSGALTLALITLSDSIKNSIQPVSNKPAQTRLQKQLDTIEDTLEKFFDFGDLSNSDKILPTTERLQLALAYFNKNNVKTISEQKQIVDNELQKARDLLPIQDTINKLSNELPKPLGVILSASSDLLTGKDYLPSGKGQDSTIGQLVRQYIRNYEELNGRNTLLTKFLSWIVGQDSNTQYSAKLKGEASQLNAIIRERLSKVIPESIREQFENLNEQHEEALNKVLTQSQLNRLQNLSLSISDVLENKQLREREIAQVEANVLQALEQLGYKGKQQAQLMNFIRWQTRGLGDWVVNQEAKVQQDKTESNILPNAKVISSLISVDKVANKSTAEQNTKALRQFVEQLVALQSLNHHNQDDLNTLAQLYKDEPKGFKNMLATMDALDGEMEIYGEDSYAGFDGYTMNKRNPYKDIKIISKSVKGWTEDQAHLQSLGYERKQVLSNGDEVWFTNENPTNRFTTGVFSMTEHSIRGMDIKTYTPLHSFDSDAEAQQVDLSNHAALNNSMYYDGLKDKTSRRTLVDNSGQIIGYSTALPKSLENDLIEIYENGIDAVGNAKGRVTEELATEVNNKTYVDKLIEVYQEKKRLGQGNRFIRIDGKYKPKGTSKANLEFANRINSIYRSLPASTRKHIDLKGGLYIERTEVDNLLGYNQASWSDVFTGKSGLPEPVQKMIRETVSTIVKIYGGNPIKFMKRTERVLGEVAGLSKDFILIRSGVVALGNMVSNLIHLWNTGVPLTQIPTLIRDGFINVRKYNEDYNKTLELRHLIQITKDKKQVAKYQLELDTLEKALEKNPVLPLVNEGILTNISSASGIEENDQFSLINTAQRKLGFTKFKQTKVGKAWGNVMVQEGSTTYSFMNASLDYGDFVAKYALYKHLTTNRQFNSERALNVIRDEFINYGLNRGRVFDWANKVGLTWFLSYKLGIQKIFIRNLRRNFLRSATVYSGAKLLGTNQVVPAQNLLFDGSLRYQTDPTNLWEGFKTHWIGQVFG